jgi:hypothetical protein
MLETLLMIPLIIFAWVTAFMAVGLGLIAIVGVFRGK